MIASPFVFDMSRSWNPERHGHQSPTDLSPEDGTIRYVANVSGIKYYIFEVRT